VKVAPAASIGATRGTTVGFGGAGAGMDSLSVAGTALDIGTAYNNGATARMAIQADVAGFYSGTLTIRKATGSAIVNTVSFSFTTRGKASAYTAVLSSTSLSPSGTANLTITVQDSAGNTTQPGMVDTFDIETVTGTTSSLETTTVQVLAQAAPTVRNLYDGTVVVVYTAGTSVNANESIKVTPRGTLGSLAATTINITTDATTIGTETATAYAATVPADADNTTSATNAAVRTGTSAVTIRATYGTSSPASGSTVRFRIYASAGTVDGVAATSAAPIYKNATVSANSSLGKQVASISLTLGGNALLAGAIVTIDQVDVANTALGGSTYTVTQTNAAPGAGTVTVNLGDRLVRALGATTSFNIGVNDQFEESLGAGFTVKAFRDGGTSADTLLSTGTTDAEGVAVVTVSPLSTVVSGGTETYVFKVSRPGVAEFEATANTIITYTTSGAITSMSTAIVTQTGSGILTPVLHTTLESALTRLPSVLVATAGEIGDSDGASFYNVTTGVNTDSSTGRSDSVKLTTTNVPANSSTFTTSTGALVCSTADCELGDGVTSLTIKNGGHAYVFATKTGIHTVTITSGDKTTTVKFYAYNLATDYYTLSASADSTSMTSGGNGVITVNLKDVFGNVVDSSGSLLTATAEGKVRLAGQALTQTLDTGIDGSFKFTVLADSTAGTGTVTITSTETGANAWGATYVPLTGYAAPVKSVTLTFTVTGATLKTTDDAVAAAEKAGADATAAANAAKAAADAAAAAAKAAETAAVAAAAKAEAEAKAATAAAQKAAADAVAAAKAAEAAAVAKAEEATDASLEAIDAANAATDAANLAAEAADAATVAAEEARDAADAATAAVEALATEISSLISGLRAQITTLANTVAKIAKKVRA